ncbi:OB-fold domain-containing protein [Candidatus Gottesmanbacteria bacterium]|nr:OB-fold domain-containing protein [Candidatus Gottesmanbacteria bacterium]MBI3559701.1 OB-fold domain-containing protein [Candidatus Gottesmanbacteria bacterium]
MLSPVKLWRNQKKVAELVGKTGRIVAWTMVRVPPADFTDQAPYPAVLVELDGGGRITAQLVDWEEKHLKIGQRVVAVVRRVIKPNTEGVIPYGIKVKPQ